MIQLLYLQTYRVINTIHVVFVMNSNVIKSILCIFAAGNLQAIEESDITGLF